MQRRPSIGWVLAIAALWLAFSIASVSVASDDTFKVIVHRDTPVTEIKRDFLRRSYLRTTIEWEHGDPVRPVDLAAGSPLRDRFAVDVIKKTPAALRNYWIQRIFSGTAVPPPEVRSPAQMIAYVSANPGAVGYIPSSADPGPTKVISLR
jgi:hypothetical protein